MEFEKNITLPLLRSLTANETNNALCIEGRFYTYRELATAIAKIRRELHKVAETHIGLVANNDLETYASIFALWLEGKCYVPLHPGQPLQRCMDIIGQVGIHVVLDSSEATRYHEQNVMMTAQWKATTQSWMPPNPARMKKRRTSSSHRAAQARPKGVPISRGNLAAFVDSFYQLGFRLNASDRCLQMFDLTFDLSVQSYLLPLLNGACAYTVDPTMIKYQAVFELLDEYHLTFALMVPSVIHYLRPYM
jgi:D-alanine--poly(phosphoribitol) ligase subunit 1